MAGSYTNALRKKLRQERSIRINTLKASIMPKRIAAKMFKGKAVSSYASKYGITNYPKSIGKLKGLHGAIQADPRMGPYIRNKKARPMTEKQKAALRKAQLASARARRQRSTGRK